MEVVGDDNILSRNLGGRNRGAGVLAIGLGTSSSARTIRTTWAGTIPAFLDGCKFLTDADRAKILGLNAAKLLKLKALARR